MTFYEFYDQWRWYIFGAFAAFWLFMRWWRP